MSILKLYADDKKDALILWRWLTSNMPKSVESAILGNNVITLDCDNKKEVFDWISSNAPEELEEMR